MLEMFQSEYTGCEWFWRPLLKLPIATYEQMRYAALYTGALLSYAVPAELRWAIMSQQAAPYWAIGCSLLSYAASYWVSLLPTDLSCTFVSCTLQIKGASFWATRHLLSYAAAYWAMQFPTELLYRLHSTELTLFVNIFRMPEWRTVRHLHCQSSTGVDKKPTPEPVRDPV